MPSKDIFTEVTYSVFHNYKVHRIFSLLSVPRSAVPCSLKSRNCVPQPIEKRCRSETQHYKAWLLGFAFGGRSNKTLRV
ncbi:MAG: hypothetical protein F6K56_15320 [Moorea sp. SIO3G5]|nr:hypothetical protein [Moorena sp. SIO3G5]